MPSRHTVVRLRNHHVRQKGGSTLIASVAPASFQTSSSLQAVT